MKIYKRTGYEDNYKNSDEEKEEDREDQRDKGRDEDLAKGKQILYGLVDPWT